MPFGVVNIMRRKFVFGLIGLMLMSVWSCKTQKTKLSFANPDAGFLVTKGDPVAIQLNFPDIHIDSVVYSVDGVVIERKSDTAAFTLNTQSLAFGSRSLSAKLYSGQDEDIAYSNIVVVPPAATRYGYEVVNVYPHDDKAFTQGLEYMDGYLYESTGREGESTLRKVDLETGTVLTKVDLDARYFGEGLTFVDNKIIQLTWRHNTGLVYDKASLRLLQTFEYQDSKEGWGICYDGEQLIKSDGTNKLYFLDADTYKEQSFVSVFDEHGPVDSLNELEYINGKIWANLYTDEVIVIIDPNTGAIEGRINFAGLHTENRQPYDNEMNGIAYDKEGERLFVTGKLWNKLYEVKVSKIQ